MNPRMQGFERDSLRAVFNSKRLWLVHLVANALLMVTFFYWTQIPDETGAQVALTVIGGLLIAFFTLWLHAATFDFYRAGAESSFKEALRQAVRRLPAFLVWAVIFGVVLWLIGRLWIYDAQAGGWARHSLPEFLRRRVNPRSTITAANWLVFFLYYFAWPIVALPFGADIASRGWRGLFSTMGFRPVREIRFWGLYAACFVIGAYVPYKLAWLTPSQPSPLSNQQISLALRLGTGYLLAVTAWLVVCAGIVRAQSEIRAAPRQS